MFIHQWLLSPTDHVDGALSDVEATKKPGAHVPDPDSILYQAIDLVKTRFVSNSVAVAVECNLL